MQCINCGEPFDLPRNELAFPCPACQCQHRLVDYLGLFDNDAEDRTRAEAVSNFRAVLESLVMFSFIREFYDRKVVMRQTLFLLDGPLLLRAQLSRLVEPIRDFVAFQRDRGRSLYLVGVEKGGEFRAFADEYATAMQNPGDFFAPTTQYVVEQINGRHFSEQTYRNRVNYGAKVVARIGSDHVAALNVPTGAFVLNPTPNALIGVAEIVRCLSQLCSYRHDNALIPIVLANAEASISNRPSSGLLGQFVDQILRSTEAS